MNFLKQKFFWTINILRYQFFRILDLPPRYQKCTSVINFLWRGLYSSHKNINMQNFLSIIELVLVKINRRQVGLNLRPHFSKNLSGNDPSRSKNMRRIRIWHFRSEKMLPWFREVLCIEAKSCKNRIIAEAYWACTPFKYGAAMLVDNMSPIKNLLKK